MYMQILLNGVGFPENLDFRKTESLGLQLVCTLVEQLDGAIELILDNGTTFSINFPRVGGEVRKFLSASRY